MQGIMRFLEIRKKLEEVTWINMSFFPFVCKASLKEYNC
jgi:hypothetical protein